VPETVNVVSKPETEYSPEELKKTDVYKQFRSDFSDLPEDALESLTRNVIKARWEARKNEAIKEFLGETFERLRELGFKAPRVLLNRDELSIIEKRAKSTRWSHTDYAEHIGVSLTREIKNSKYDERNGEYKLLIEEPHPDHDVPFKLRLVELSGFEVRFPPVDPDNPQETDTYREVTSVTNVMRKSVLQHPQSPAVFFRMSQEKDEGEKPEDAPEGDTPKE
jgi:hypothetical protein